MKYTLAMTAKAIKINCAHLGSLSTAFDIRVDIIARLH
jgi:hypothetical protein